MLSLVRFHHRTKDDIRPCWGPMGNLGDDGGRFIQWLRSIALRPVRVTEACSPPRPSASAAGPSLRTTVVSASVRRESTADDAYIVYSYMYARENGRTLKINQTASRFSGGFIRAVKGLSLVRENWNDRFLYVASLPI